MVQFGEFMGSDDCVEIGIASKVKASKIVFKLVCDCAGDIVSGDDRARHRGIIHFL